MTTIDPILSFDGKPSPDNPVGVLGRQPDTPFAVAKAQANPRTPTLPRSSGVLAIPYEVKFTYETPKVVSSGIPQ